jgi:hypothetical protein
LNRGYALNWWIGWGTGSGADETANNVTVGVAIEAREAATAPQGMITVANDTRLPLRSGLNCSRICGLQ